MAGHDGRVRKETIGPDRDEAEAALTPRLAESTSASTTNSRRRLHVFARSGSPATVPAFTLLRQVLAAAARDGYIARNPVDDVRRLKAAPKPRPFLKLDQVEPLLKVTQAKDRPLLLTLLMAGLRIGEARALR